MANKLIIATRESPLALWQANWVKSQLQQSHPQVNVELLGLTTQADRMFEMPLIKMGGKGVFVKELEEALLDGRADIAVHSMKDVPMDLPPDLIIPVMSPREESRDVLVSNQARSLDDLKPHARLGTSSLRRQSQLLALRPDLNMLNLRGNVNTRLRKLDKGEFDALILAAAGLIRLGFENRITAFLSLEQSLPAAGQGVLGVECRADNREAIKLLENINDKTAFNCVSAERAMCKMLGGGCQVPVAAYAEINNQQLTLRGLVASIDGKKILKVTDKDAIENAEALGQRVAKALLQQGAGEILNAI